MMQNVLCCLMIAGMAAQADEAGNIKITRVFGPEIPGRYKHPASITELENGDLYLAYYTGEGEYEGDTMVKGARLAKGAEAWTDPEVIANTPFRSEGNPVVWQAPDGMVWLFYVVRYGETWSSSRINAKISKDGARTWSDPVMIAMEQGMMVRSKPIVLDGGDYLLPIYHETGFDRENVGADTTSLFLRGNPKTCEWTETNRIASRLGNLQPTVAQITPEHLICYCRRGGGYDPIPDGYIVKSESRDGGQTWSSGEDTEFPNPNAAVDLTRLQNGHLLLVYNDSMSERTPLAAAISEDNGKTYPHRRNIVTGEGGDYAYPYAIQTRDGSIHLIFTSEGRTVINHAVFDEDAVLNKDAR
jgi:predicted neuraminidase